MKIAVIPARGGSKRVPRKNIKSFCGRPLISYSISTAVESGLFDRIIVSTDDHDIASIAQEYGAEVPFYRPDNLANDHASTWAVVKHALQAMQEQGCVVDLACCIYATAPFLRSRYLEQGLTLLTRNTDKSFAFSVTSFPFPIMRAINIENGVISPTFPEYIGKRSQDLPECYHDAGQFYWGRPEAYINNISPFSDKGIPVKLPRHLVQDIDTPEDWERAELMYKAYVNSENVNKDQI